MYNKSDIVAFYKSMHIEMSASWQTEFMWQLMAKHCYWRTQASWQTTRKRRT